MSAGDRFGTLLGWPSRRQAKGGEEDEEAADGCPDRALVTLVPAVPANAASPQARCPRQELSPGQELSALAPELGADLGAEISEFAHADRENCSEE